MKSEEGEWLHSLTKAPLSRIAVHLDMDMKDVEVEIRKRGRRA